MRVLDNVCHRQNSFPSWPRFRALSRIAVVACVSFAAQGLYAQGTASVVGVVNDSSGAIVPEAVVTISNEGTGLKQSATTDSGGRYNFLRLPIGNYAHRRCRVRFQKGSADGY